MAKTALSGIPSIIGGLKPWKISFVDEISFSLERLQVGPSSGVSRYDDAPRSIS
jgi:hypothetical protein